MNNKGADQTARMRRLICAFVVRILHKTHFRMTWPIWLIVEIDIKPEQTNKPSNAYWRSPFSWDGSDSLEFSLFVPVHDKTNKMICASSEDSDQPSLPFSLFRWFKKSRCQLLAKEHALSLINCPGGLPRNSVVRVTDRAWNHPKCVEGP